MSARVNIRMETDVRFKAGAGLNENGWWRRGGGFRGGRPRFAPPPRPPPPPHSPSVTTSGAPRMPHGGLSFVASAAVLTSVASAEPWLLAFGSCHHQDLPSPALTAAAALKPDVFVWLGDNLYNDVAAQGMLCEPWRCAGDARSWYDNVKDAVLVAAHKLLVRPPHVVRGPTVLGLMSSPRVAGAHLSPPHPPTQINFPPTRAFVKRVAEEIVMTHNRGSGEHDLAALQQSYDRLAQKEEFRALEAVLPRHTHQLATWDDHDCRSPPPRSSHIAK